GGRVRRSAVGGLGDRAEAPVGEVGVDSVEVAVELDAGAGGGVDEWPEQPWPDRPLVVRGVAFGRTAPVVGAIATIVGRGGAEAERRQERAAADLDDAARGLALEKRPVG